MGEFSKRIGEIGEEIVVEFPCFNRLASTSPKL
jgi:hypothetical protein